VTTIAAALGSVTPPGRLSSAVGAALDHAARSGHSAQLFDLGQLTLGFADGRPIDQLTGDEPRFVAGISAADAVLLATPVYRGTLTGALKNALDLLPVEALQGKPVGIVAMGATLHHSLGAESHLRDILAWFGALTLPVAVYLSSADFTDGVLNGNATATLTQLIDSLAALASATSTVTLGPPPLASGRRP
jgi:FMN reductase